jgi:hypothetical protein
MTSRVVLLSILLGACNGASGTDGTDGTAGSNGASGEQGPQGVPGQAGQTGQPGEPGPAGPPGPQGPSGTAAILLATDELQPTLTGVPDHGPGSPPYAICSTPPTFTFTTTTGHILVQRSDLSWIVFDDGSLSQAAPSGGQMLLAAHVTPNVPHSVAAFSGSRVIDDWRLGACSTSDLHSGHGCVTEGDGDGAQCWCIPASCPSYGTILITELP